MTIESAAQDLSAAWSRYQELFGEVPHGTVVQMAALLELAPQIREGLLAAEPHLESKP